MSPVLAAVLCAGAATAQPGCVRFTDGAFAGWNATYFTSSTSSGSAVVLAAGGNPGAYYDVTNTPSQSGIAPNGRILTVLVNPAAVHDPGVDGPVCAVTTGVDTRHLSAPAFSTGHEFHAVALQGGNMFLGPGQPVGRPPAWQALATAELAQSDFRSVGAVYAGFGAPVAGPDFSDAGAPLTFGFALANNSIGGAYTVRQGYDNWAVAVAVAPWGLGAGCGSAGPVTISASPATPCAVVGRRLTTDVTNLPSSVWLMGFAFGPIAPINLGTLGGPAACTVEASPSVLLGGSGAPSASLSISVPPNPALRCVTFVNQVFAIDPGATTPLQVATSNALRFTVN